MSGPRLAAAALCALWVMLGAALAFDAAVLGQSERLAQTLREDLNAVTQELRNPALDDQKLTEIRSALEKLRTDALTQSDLLSSPVTEVNQQISSLGPAPDAGKTEPEGVAKTRADLQATRDRLLSVKSQLDVIGVEAEQQGGRVAALQRDQFLERIFDRNRSILNPSLWYDTGVGISVFSARVSALVRNWWSETSATSNPLILLIIPIFIAILAAVYWGAHHWLSHWTARFPGASRSPDDINRLWRIVLGQITTVAALFILLIPIELTLQASGYQTPRITLLWHAITFTLSGTLIYHMLARRLASPGLPQWRIINLDEAAASRFSILASLTAFVAVANSQLTTLAEGLYLGVNYAIGQSALAALAMLVLMSLIVLTLNNQQGLANPGGRQVYFRWASVITPLMWVVIIVGFLALLLGYLALANYIAQKVFRTGLLVTVLFLLHHLSDAAVASSFDPQSGFGRFIRRMTGLGERAIERMGLIFRTSVDIILVLAGLPLLFVLWTVTWVDFGSMLNTAALGVRIGEVTLSPGVIALVLVILGAGVLLTKLFNSWLDRRILSETRINKGVQDSLRKGASYAGYLLAIGFALTAAGFDFSSLAIIAGALGVGIGFGLQSIVNNFISGLILLAERPIRVGDWVVLDSGQGLVKRINVRATEIETFDSCTIIVPNLTLITGVVKNWTHGDTIGQFMVAVTVDALTDAEIMRKLLLATAREHSKVLTYPEPGVTLARIHPTGLDFELRANVADVFEAGKVASDIRFSLLAQFREKGIMTPPPPAVIQAPQH
jgi:potassium efflux system protein